MTDLRIQFNEEMVGAGHPVKADTLNRLAIAEHNNDGTHNKLTRITDPWRDIRADGAVDGADVGALINTSIASSSNIFIPAGDWYLETPVLVDGKAVHFRLEYGATLHVKNNTAGIKSQNAGAVLRISGDGQINGVAGYAGYGIHVTYGKLVISSLNFYQTNNWSIFLDRTNGGYISYSQIGRIFAPDSWGVRIEGIAPGGSIDSYWGDIKFAGSTRSELIYIKNATDVTIGSIMGGVNAASKAAIYMEQSRSITIASSFVSSLQYYGCYIDQNCREIVFGNAQDYNSNVAWFIDGDEIQIGNMMNISARTTSVEFATNCTGVQIGNMICRDGSSVTPSACVTVASASSRISLGSVWINSSNDMHSFNLPADNRVILNNIGLLVGTTAKFKGNILPYRASGGGDTGSVVVENSGTYTGNGGSTVYTISHGLVPSITPQVASVLAASAGAAGDFYISNVTNTAIEVTYVGATPPGTGNISLRWSARLTP